MTLLDRQNLKSTVSPKWQSIPTVKETVNSVLIIGYEFCGTVRKFEETNLLKSSPLDCVCVFFFFTYMLNFMEPFSMNGKFYQYYKKMYTFLSLV